ncbi:MAG: Fe-S protein assembly chaperone HscA [Cellvibrionaceae bacterium]
MVLLQISEPGQSPEPHARKRAVGIDLGTTNSLVATVRSGTPATLAEEGRVIVPSVVHYTAEGLRVGHQAKLDASQDPLNTIISVKRLMGRGISDVKTLGDQLPYEFIEGKGMPWIKTAAGNKSPVQVSADILHVLAKRGEKALGGELDGCVITVPAYFDDAQRQATKDAAKLAGLKVLRLLNEPTAAAVAYGLDRGEEGIVAIYDLGGGTFDISILRLSKGVFEVLATGGDSALGGDDFDRAVANWVVEEAGLNTSLSPQQQRELLDVACTAKEKLAQADFVSLTYGDWCGSLSREKLAELIDPLIQKTLRACKRALRDASLDVDDVKNVVMVGGSTRTLRVREKVAEQFNCEPLTDIDPDQVVAIGASIQADMLVGNKPDEEMLLLDVIPLSLGIETMGGLVEKLIQRNTTIPVAKAQEFTTFKDGQTAMAIHVLQGEREMVEDCRSLARFELHDIPPMAAGAAHIRVTFQVDADGLLSVTAEEKSSGSKASIEVKPSYGLDDNTVAQMLKDSYAYAADDMEKRALREQQVEAERMLESVRAALAEDSHLLSEQEIQHLNGELENLMALHNGTDHKAIAAQIEKVATATEAFAARRMNESIRKALTGHNMDEFGQ